VANQEKFTFLTDLAHQNFSRRTVLLQEFNLHFTIVAFGL